MNTKLSKPTKISELPVTYSENPDEKEPSNLFEPSLVIAITTLSKLDNDRAHQTTEVWTYTFLGNKDGNKLSTEQDIVANVFSLEKNYPNPFNPTTTIEYSIGIAGPAKLMIYDILGREVVSLVNEYKQVGRHKVMWNASTMSSGVYFYRLETPTFTKTQKMILMK